MQQPRTEFAQALRAIATERNLEADVILDTIKQAIIAAYKRDARERGEDTEVMDFEVQMDPGTGEAKIFAWPLENPEQKKDVTPPGFGRIAAQTAKQVIHQKIREAEKGAIMGEFSGRIGSLISGMVLRFDGQDVRVDLGRTEGLMPKEERVLTEKLNLNQRLTFLLKDIIETPKGKQIILSRADPLFVVKLFEREVPEMSSGSVEMKVVAREAGARTKMAVASNQSGVDPVGSCVGQKGVRVQAVTNELGGERVDIIQYTNDIGELIKAALSPAENLSVKLDEKKKIAVVKAPEDQLSLAIGKDGQNARLAAKMTGWKIEIKSSDEGKIVKEEKSDNKLVSGDSQKIVGEAETVKAKIAKKEIKIDKRQDAIKTNDSSENPNKPGPEPEIEKIEKRPVSNVAQSDAGGDHATEHKTDQS